jgi:hypothetical protein
MSTISVGGLSQLYQSGSLYAPQVQTTDPNDPSNPTVSVDQSNATTDGSTQQVQGHHHHHHAGGAGGAGQQGFFSKLQAAVTSALQSAQSGGAGTDPNQAIQNAIESVVKGDNNGDSSSSTDATASTSETSTTDSSAPVDPQAAREQFFQTLQSYGVDPQQFHQDFLSAMEAAKGGNVDPSSAFSSLPPGSVVDTSA